MALYPSSQSSSLDQASIQDISQRQQIYLSTKSSLDELKNIFGFDDVISKANLNLFYSSIFTTRVHFKSPLVELEKTQEIQTYNSGLIYALCHDLPIELLTHLSPNDAESLSTDEQLGVYYVLTDFYADDKMVFEKAITKGLTEPFYYFNEVNKIAYDQEKILNSLLANEQLNEELIIKGAQDTIEFIKQVATSDNIQNKSLKS